MKDVIAAVIYIFNDFIYVPARLTVYRNREESQHSIRMNVFFEYILKSQVLTIEDEGEEQNIVQ